MKISADLRISKGVAQGFTVLDLLGVTGVLAVFGFLMAPVWVSTMADARTALCVGNLEQVGRAAAVYASDHNDSLPGNQHSQPSWVQSLAKYCLTNSYRCPEEIAGNPARSPRPFTIALNDFLTPHPFGARKLDFSTRGKITAPAETIMFAEADEEYRAYDHFHFADARGNGFEQEAFEAQVDAERHSGAANYLYADGHVEGLAWSSGARAKLGYPGSKFVHPAGKPARPELAAR